MEVTLRWAGNEGAISQALLEGLKGEVRIRGGGGPNSVQRALGQ